MRALAAVLLAVVSSCGWESPTEPRAELPRSVAVIGDSLFAMDPPLLTLRPGERRTVTVRGRWDYPLGVRFQSGQEDLALIRGAIPPGGREAVVEVEAIRAGEPQMVAVVFNFGRAPGLHLVDGRIAIGQPARQRAVRR